VIGRQPMPFAVIGARAMRKRLLPAPGHKTNAPLRRLLPVVVRPSEGRFTKPTAAIQPWQLELVLMTPIRPFTIVAAEAQSRIQRNADLTSRPSSRIASRSAP
jgi:hypothetical protein